MQIFLTSTANDIWTGNSQHDPLLTGEDTSDPTENEDLQILQPDDLKYANNLHIGGNDMYEDGYNSQNSELKNWGAKT